MRNLLALAAAALLVFAGVGWYLGWYTISSSSDGSGHQKINIDVDKNKISEDIDKGKQKLRDLLANKQKEADASSGRAESLQPSSAPPPLPHGLQILGDGTLVLPPVDPKAPILPADYTPRPVPPE